MTKREAQIILAMIDFFADDGIEAIKENLDCTEEEWKALEQKAKESL